MSHPAALLTLDRVPYADAWALQRRLVRARAEDRAPDTLVLLEHDPTYTIGRSGTRHGAGVQPPRVPTIPVFEVERGGSITFHGPGQVVGYPIVHLRTFCPGPKAYMRKLEEVLIRVLAGWGIDASRRDKLPGVWVGTDRMEKIAAMGVRITQGVTMHGFALNVDMDLAPFDRIVPCSIEGCRVTSIARLLGRAVDVRAVQGQVAEVFRDLFGLHWIVGQMGERLQVVEDIRSHGQAEPLPVSG